MLRLVRQTKTIVEGLKKTESIPLKHFDIAAWLEKHVPIAANDTLPIPSSSGPQEVKIELVGDPDELAARAKKEADAESKRCETMRVQQWESCTDVVRSYLQSSERLTVMDRAEYHHRRTHGCRGSAASGARCKRADHHRKGWRVLTDQERCGRRPRCLLRKFGRPASCYRVRAEGRRHLTCRCRTRVAFVVGRISKCKIGR